MTDTREISLSPDVIDMDDDRYRISAAFGSSGAGIGALVESIRAIGVINFPILEKKPGGYRIVCGFKRIQACRMLGIQAIRCRIADHSWTEMDCLKRAVTDNAMARHLSTLEQARAAVKLRLACGSDADLPELAKPLGVEISADLVEKYERLCRLPEDIQQLVDDGGISMKVALEMEKLDGSSAAAAAMLFKRLRPTVNHQQELLSGLKAIAAVSDISIVQLLSSPPLTDIIEKNGVDRKTKIRMLRGDIRRLRYPYMTRFYDRFYDHLRSVDLPGGVSIAAPKDFESPVFKLTVDFSNTEELRRKADQLKQLGGRSELESLLKRDIEDT